MSRHYLPFELDRIKALKKKILVGSVMYDQKGKPVKEMLKLIWVKELIYSRLPKPYWTAELDKLKIKSEIKSVTNKYLKNYKIAKANGLGFIFHGANGVGKTSAATAIARVFLKKSYNIVYITAQTYMDFEMEFENPENRQAILNRLKEADMILLDEWDKLYMKVGSTYAIKKIENFLREMLSLNKMLLICTNLEEEEIVDMFNKSIYSLIQRHLKFIHFTGKDHSKTKRAEWDELLEGDKRSVNKIILMKDAGEFYEQRENRNKSESIEV